MNWLALYPTLIRPLLFRADPEWVHDRVNQWAMGITQLYGGGSILHALTGELVVYPELSQHLWGYSFDNPVGLAAGFDKNVRLPAFMAAMGFGFEEVGSITAQPSVGNPKPRLFRLPHDKALINRMGLNNEGIEAIAPRLAQLPKTWPVGISIAKTHNPDILGEAALQDFEASLRGAFGYGAYVSINISCPNTREGKTFEEPEALGILLSRLRETESRCVGETSRSSRPWLLKISPDLPLDVLDGLYGVALEYDIAGWVVSNTSSGRQGLRTPARALEKIGPGGLSGAPLHQLSLARLAHLYRLSQGKHVLIGVGGIDSPERAWESITHGASLLQLYTGFIYEGPALIPTLCHGLRSRLQQHGFTHLSQAVGSAT